MPEPAATKSTAASAKSKQQQQQKQPQKAAATTPAKKTAAAPNGKAAAPAAVVANGNGKASAPAAEASTAAAVEATPTPAPAEATTAPKSASSVSTLPTTPKKSLPAQPPPPVRQSSGHSKGSSSGGPAPGSGGGGITEEVEVVFLESLNKKYECPVCGQVLRYPVQFEECGHRCCSSCLPDLLRVAPRCPLDQMVIDKDKVYTDKAFQAETDNLGVKCSFYGRGCPWTGVLKELMAHMESCDRMMTTCPMRCGVEFEKRFLQKHRDEDCPKRQVVCQFCELKLLAEDEPQHLEACPKFPVPCPNKCKKKEVAREKLQEHLDNDCLQQSQPCPFANYGCDYTGKKTELKSHLAEKQVSHMEILCAAIKQSEKSRDDKERLVAEMTRKLATLETRISCLEKLYGPQLVWRIDAYSDKLAEAKSGKKSTVFSQPFLTHRHGYKMAVSACLNGDGQARGKYMSVFVCICKGDNDALLAWPFAHRVNIQLLDQCEDPKARRHVTYSVKPNTCKENRPFLGRPVGERNASFGAAKFVELETLGTLDYIKDDAMFIKVEVDCATLQPL